MKKKISLMAAVLALCLTLSACQILPMILGNPEKKAVADQVHQFIAYFQVASFTDEDDWSTYTDQEMMQQLFFSNPEAHRVLAVAAGKLTYEIISIESDAMEGSGEPYWLCKLAVKMPDIDALVAGNPNDVDADILIGRIENDNMPMLDYDMDLAVHKIGAGETATYRIDFIDVATLACVAPYLSLAMAPTDAYVTDILEAFVEANRAFDLEAMQKLSVGIDSINDLYDYDSDELENEEALVIGIVERAATRIQIENARVTEKSSMQASVAFEMNRPDVGRIFLDVVYDENVYVEIMEKLLPTLLSDDDYEGEIFDQLMVDLIVSAVEKEMAAGDFYTLSATEELWLVLQGGQWQIDGSRIPESYVTYGYDAFDNDLFSDVEIEDMLLAAVPQAIDNLFQRGEIDEWDKDFLLFLFADEQQEFEGDIYTDLPNKVINAKWVDPDTGKAVTSYKIGASVLEIRYELYDDAFPNDETLYIMWMMDNDTVFITEDEYVINTRDQADDEYYYVSLKSPTTFESSYYSVWIYLEDYTTLLDAYVWVK